MKFGHHPDPAIDFCIEVDELQGMAYNRKIGFDAEPQLEDRVFRAMLFRVGGDGRAIDAKQTLRDIKRQIEPGVKL